MTTSIQTDLRSILHALPHHDPRFKPWIDEDPGYQPFLEIARELQPRSVLEFGTLLGYSLVAFMEGSPGLTTIDWIDGELYLPDSNVLCRRNLVDYSTRSGRPKPTNYHYDSPWKYTRFHPFKVFGPPDLVHIDGDHSTLGKLRDLIITHELVKPKWILVDDLIKPSVWAGVNSFLRAVPDTYQEETIEPSRGLILLTRKS